MKLGVAYICVTGTEIECILRNCDLVGIISAMKTIIDEALCHLHLFYCVGKRVA